MPNYLDLSGRVVLVTGANIGIGQALAVALAQAGADVGRSPDGETVEQVQAIGRRATFVAADLSTIEPVKSRGG